MKMWLLIAATVSVVAGVFAIFLMNYSRAASGAEIPGEYFFALGNVSQAISVSGDGTYQSVVYVSGKKSWSDHGSWQQDNVGGKSGVTFAKFRFGIPGYSVRPGYWFVVPEMTIMGKGELCFDPVTLPPVLIQRGLESEG
jgi:hypothetical protein